MSICRGDLAKATFEGQPAETDQHGTSVRRFICKDYPRFAFIETRGSGFEKTVVFEVDGKRVAGLTEAIARLNERLPAPLVNGQRPPVDMSAQVRWAT